MKNLLKEGIIGEKKITVAKNNTAIAYGSGLLPVFATPAMIAFMENTAHESIENALEPGFTTVGTEINVSHLKASPIGKEIYCKTELFSIEERKLTFNVQVFDNEGIIGKGTHVRFIVNAEKFMNKLK